MIRVLFPDISNPTSGRSFFLNALAEELPNHGVEVVYGDAEHDISLHPIRLWRKTKKPKILRIDGVYHNTAIDWKAKNENIKDSAHKSDGIICQSKFSKIMAMMYLEIPECKTKVIFNGVKIEENKYDYSFDCKLPFMAISRWRPHKRLTDIIESFLLANLNESQLLIFGDISKSDCDIYKYKNNNKIVYAGTITDRDKLKSYYHYAIASIHLCWFDSCPNSVVEALSCGCPVITNNVGGTCELVAPSGGIVCNIDKPYDYFPVDLYHPNPIDRNIVAEAIINVSKNKPGIKNNHIDIKVIAKQYKEYFDEFI